MELGVYLLVLICAFTSLSLGDQCADDVDKCLELMGQTYPNFTSAEALKDILSGEQAKQKACTYIGGMKRAGAVLCIRNQLTSCGEDKYKRMKERMKARVDTSDQHAAALMKVYACQIAACPAENTRWADMVDHVMFCTEINDKEETSDKCQARSPNPADAPQATDSRCWIEDVNMCAIPEEGKQKVKVTMDYYRVNLEKCKFYLDSSNGVTFKVNGLILAFAFLSFFMTYI